MFWKWATLVPDALQRSTVIRNDDMPTFPGHSVTLCGNTLLAQNSEKCSGNGLVWFPMPYKDQQ